MVGDADHHPLGSRRGAKQGQSPGCGSRRLPDEVNLITSASSWRICERSWSAIRAAPSIFSPSKASVIGCRGSRIRPSPLARSLGDEQLMDQCYTVPNHGASRRGRTETVGPKCGMNEFEAAAGIPRAESVFPFRLSLPERCRLPLLPDAPRPAAGHGRHRQCHLQSPREPGQAEGKPWRRLT